MDLLSPFNYHQWKEDMETKLHSKVFRLTMEIEAEPILNQDKEKYWNRLDEAYGCLCLSISQDILFHINGLNIHKHVSNKLASLFDKQDDLRIYQLENG